MNNALITRNSRLATLLRTGIVAAMLAIGAGCASNDEQETVINNITEAYQSAKTSVSRGNYTRGIQIFEAIQARYPFSELSRQVQLDLMFAYYKAGRTEEAVETADTFMRENPIHESVDYALYIKGLAYFEDEAGFLEKRFKKDVTERPPKDVEEAYSSFRRLIERYPASQYAAEVPRFVTRASTLLRAVQIACAVSSSPSTYPPGELIASRIDFTAWSKSAS